MPHRKQSLGFYRQKLKAVFVLMVMIIGCYTLLEGLDSPAPPGDFQLEQSRYWSQKIDSLRIANQAVAPTLYPFNPNSINDYRAYRLGLSTTIVDRVQAYRNQGKWLQSLSDFQRVTQVADTTMQRIERYFTFPKRFSKTTKLLKKSEPKIDLNTATAAQLQKVRGIGPAYSGRILRYREKISAYVSMDQLKEVYGLSDEVIQALNRRFTIKQPVALPKRSFEHASLEELANLPYLTYDEARQLVAARTKAPKKSLDSVLIDAGWSLDKVWRIKLYLY